ncbi:hypothetical protein [Shewanella sp.]|uniref:hypothetical protein n=1 Tax=Shewanella sp. TaxID=50422 RepID=UPI004048E42A
MSSTNGNVRANELYPTPDNVVDALLAQLVLNHAAELMQYIAKSHYQTLKKVGQNLIAVLIT